MATSQVIFPSAGGSFIVQSGSQSVNASTTATVTLPIAYSGIANYVVFAVASDALVTPANDIGLQVLTTTTFSLRNNDAGGAHTINWVAIGF